MNDLTTFSWKTARARRRSRSSSDRSVSAPSSTCCRNAAGLNRTNATSNDVTSASAFAKIRSCVFSASGCGVKIISPRPRSTRAVTPSSVFARKACPDDIDSRRSVESMTRFLTVYSVGSTASSYSPSSRDSRS